MQPSPGRIHTLPVKVLYTIDSHTQSYLTILNDRQDVYVHPSAVDDGQGPVGSTYLKAISNGICFSSPECIPNSNSLDFSVYNLDPTLRHRSSRAFQSNTPRSHSPGSSSHEEPSWVGKGFLSWSMSEPNIGNTLIKGRLIREYDFSPSRFNEQGGLEGLMAGHNAHGGRDEPGWGLEVCLSLKMVNPGGKEEFSGRREFEEMLFSGRTPQVSSSAQSGRNGSTPAHNATSIPTPSSNTTTVRRPSPQPPLPQQNRTNGTTPTQNYASPPILSSSSALPQQTKTQSAPVRQPTPQRSQQPQAVNQSGPRQPPHRPSSGLSHTSQSHSSLPPSSYPMASSSSHQGQISRPQSSVEVEQRQQETPSSETPPPLPSSTANMPQREVTPPPPARPKSPPPTTPHRRALRNLLQTDGKMSPKLAKELVNNPTLLALFKAVPGGVHLGGNNNASSSTSRPPGQASKPVQHDHRSSPQREGTPTPTNSATIKPLGPLTDGCFNCGTLETTMWRVKTYQDGSKKKVCDACGVYFNKNKRMRPKELWDQKEQNSVSSSASQQNANQPNAKRSKIDHEVSANLNGLRSSPRLQRTANHNGSGQHHQVAESQAESSRQGAARNSSVNSNNQGAPSIPNNPTVPVIPESPRRRKNAKPIPQPSPRMATRSSARLEQSTSGEGSIPFQLSPIGSAGFGTSPAVPLDMSNSNNRITTGSNNDINHFGNFNQNNNANGANANGNALVNDDIDIESLLSSLASASNNGEGYDINLDEFFANLAAESVNGTGGIDFSFLGDGSVDVNDHGAGTGDQGGEDMMKFLAGMEADENEAN